MMQPSQHVDPSRLAPPGTFERASGDALRHVLVIDDDPTVRLLVGHWLSRRGYVISEASDGATGIERARRDLPSLILLDFMLPDITGHEVLRRLRASEATRDVPVILLSATEQASHIAAGFAAGANDYLMKPVDPRLIEERIDAAIAARDLMRGARTARARADRHEQIVADLEGARDEQESKLAVLPAAWSGWWAVGGVASCGLLGGDVVAICTGSRGERTALVIDVAGHGAGAALVGASVQTALAMLLRHYDLPTALAALNDELLAASTPRHACVAAVQVDGCSVTIVNAGLPPVYVARKGQVIREVVSSGVPPGLFASQTYTSASFSVMRGDRIAVVSDGLVEPFGLIDNASPIIASLGAFDDTRWSGAERPQTIADRMRQTLARVSVTQPDDATLLLLHAAT
jgi:phosphoserine phosphatase RsbU/P